MPRLYNRPMRAVLDKFLADRGTHLAAMIAYFALLSFVPLLFIALSLLGLAGEQDESSYLIEQLRKAFPESSVNDLIRAVREIQRGAGELTAIGLVGLVWGSLGFFSALESAFNTVYGVPNRPFARQKGLMLLLIAGALVLGFTWSAYRLITNVPLGWRETLPGALFATALLEGSFQIVPVFVRATNAIVSLQAFGGLLVMLVWLYLMANVLVLGAEVNLRFGKRPAPPP